MLTKGRFVLSISKDGVFGTKNYFPKLNNRLFKKFVFSLSKFQNSHSPMEQVAGQLGLKSSRPLSQVGPGSTRPESTRPGDFSECPVTYISGLFCIIFPTIKDNY